MTMRVRVRVKGPIGPVMAAAFDDVELHTESVLAGDLSDEAAVHGLLTRVRDLGLQVIEIQVGGAPPTGSS